MRLRTPSRLASLALVVATIGSLSAVADIASASPPASPNSATCLTVPLGDSDLTESCSTQSLATGITYTRIVRGTTPADPSDIQTTTAGPWVINAVTIDPHKARGRLQVVRGQYLINRATVSERVAQARGLVGVNASFFDIDNNSGEPTGFAVWNGQLVGEPCDPTEVCKAPYTIPTDEGGPIKADGAIIDEANNRLLLNTFKWSGKVRSLKTGTILGLTNVDASPTVPSECAGLVDQTQCTVPGRLVRIDTHWGPETPSGLGVEAVLDRRGCVIRTATTRGTKLAPGQTSLQATGSDTVALLNLVRGGGCLKTDLAVFEKNGHQVRLTPTMQGVSGWGLLVKNGVNVYDQILDQPTGGRHAETSVGDTRDGKIVLMTIDGEQTTSVGVSSSMLADAMLAFGAANAVQLDGGGSSEMVVKGDVVNSPSDGSERAIGDALVWVP